MANPDFLSLLFDKALTFIAAAGLGYVASWLAFGKRIETEVEKRVNEELLKRSAAGADARAEIGAEIRQLKASNQARDERDESQAQEQARSWQEVQRVIGKIEGLLESQKRGR